MSALVDLAHGLPAERLVPGDPAAVSEVGRVMSGYVEVLAEAARALGRIEVEWEGDAASRFRDEFGLQPARFTAAASSFDIAAQGLGRYGRTLESAQLVAGRASELFADGIRAAAAAEGGVLGVVAGPLDLLTSPAGRDQRLAAVELLERAREDVDRCGNETAGSLRSAMAGTPEPLSAWQHAWNFVLAPPWDLNEERRDWVAGAVVGTLDTLILASNPLPLALWVAATTKPQVNAFEWRLGANPRSGFHTAAAVVVPSILTGASVVSTAPSARFGMTLTELEGKAPESINLYRGMRAAPDGLPEVGQTAKTLGVRPKGDITVVDGVLGPGTGGMSVSTSIDGLPAFRRPPVFGGTAKDLSVFQIDQDEFGALLVVVPDRASHCTVQPVETMTYAQYQRLLQETRTRWTVVEPE